MGDLEGKYPHWKDALFGNHGLRANLRCGVKYIVWHSSYALLALFGVLAVAGAEAFDRTVNTETADKIGKLLENNLLKKAIRGVIYAVTSLLALAFAGTVVYVIVTEPLATLAATLAIVGAVVIIFGIAFALDYVASTETAKNAGEKVADGVSTVGQKSKVTPVARRVYGHCPVSMDLEPKWFEKRF